MSSPHKAVPVVVETQKVSSSLPKNLAWMAWSGTISIANSVVLWAMFARWRNTAELGHFTVVMGLYMIFVTVSTLGLGPYLSSETARRKDALGNGVQAFIASSTVFLFLWSAFCALAMTAAGMLLSSSVEVRQATAVLSLAMLPTGIIAVAEPVCTAYGRSSLIALVTTIENVLRTVLPLLLLWSGRSLAAICVALVAVRFIACLIYCLAARHHLGQIRRVRCALMLKIAARAPAFAFITILSSLHFQAASVLIGRLGSETDSAQFGAASRFLIPVMVLMGSYVSVIQPNASRLALVSLEEMGAFLSRSLRLALLLALPCGIGTLLLAPELLTFLFSEKLAAAAPALALLGLGMIPFAAVMILSRGLIATGNQRIDLLGNAAAVQVNLLLNLWLIPRYGATGAAAAQFVSLLTLLLIELRWSARHLYKPEAASALTEGALPLLLLVVMIWQLRGFGLWLAASAAATAYVFALILTQKHFRTAIAPLLIPVRLRK